MKFYLMLTLALVLAACGNNTNNAHKNHHDEDHKNGHGDKHGEAHAMGQHEVDGYVIAAAWIELGKEGIFELTVKQEGRTPTGASVTAWVADRDAKEVSRTEKAEWMSAQQKFDCHIEMPPKIPEGARLWVRVRHADKDLKADFELPKP